jgi:protein-S-isoprenylcysteine O-methyltransferase Ste14
MEIHMTMILHPDQNSAFPATPSRAIRSLGLVYGLLSYAVFLGTFAYAIGFLTGNLVPKTIDDGSTGAWSTALMIDLALMSVFAVQHSGMARRTFKSFFARFFSPAVERSTFVLLASLSLVLLFSQRQPLPTVVWGIDGPVFAGAVAAGGAVGRIIVLYSTFELFGFLIGAYGWDASLKARTDPS